MARGPDRASRLLVAGIILLSAALIGVGGYVAVLTTRPDKAAAAEGPARAPEAELEQIMRSIARLGADGEWDRARAAAREAVRRYPEDKDLRLRYAELLQRVGEAKAAYEQYVEALRIGPRDANTEYLAGRTATQAGDREAALDHLRRAHNAKPEVGEYALHLGLTQFNLEKFEQARASLYLAAQQNPDNATAWGMLAQIALRRGNREMAREYIAKARELEPGSVVWRVVEADALVKSDPERAAELLSRVAPEDLPTPYGLNVAKAVFGVMGRHAEAARYFAHASDQNPDDAGRALETADLYERAGMAEKARTYARRARKADEPAAQKMLDRLKGEG